MSIENKLESFIKKNFDDIDDSMLSEAELEMITSAIFRMLEGDQAVNLLIDYGYNENNRVNWFVCDDDECSPLINEFRESRSDYNELISDYNELKNDRDRLADKVDDAQRILRQHGY